MNVLVIPGCDDTNRGDQALIWESVRLAKDAGVHGNYYMISTEESSIQSKREGIKSIPYILPHPSVYYQKLRDNREYTTQLKLLWGIRAIGDLLVAVPLTKRKLRRVAKVFLSKEKKISFETFEKAEIAIVKGGGFLHSKRGISEDYKIYFFLYHILLALSMNIPVFIMPNSFGSFEGKYARYLINRTLNKCEVVTARESISQKVLLNECSVSSKVFMDLGVYLQKDEDFDAICYLKKYGISLKKGKSVVITVRPYRFLGCDDPSQLYSKYIISIVSLIKWLNINGYYPVLAEHVYSSSYHESDIKAIEDVKKLLSKEDDVVFGVIADHSLNCRQMKSIYSCFDYMVGTRFHSVIFSIFSDVPAIAITYGGNKGLGIMKDLGLGEYAIGIDVVDSDSLIDTFKRMVAKREEYLQIIHDANDKISDQRQELISLLQLCIGKKKY